MIESFDSVCDAKACVVEQLLPCSIGTWSFSLPRAHHLVLKDCQFTVQLGKILNSYNWEKLQTLCGQAGIILGVVSKSTEQTVSTALQESGVGMLDGGHSRQVLGVEPVLEVWQSHQKVQWNPVAFVLWLGVLDCHPAKRTIHKDIQISSCVVMSMATSLLAFWSIFHVSKTGIRDKEYKSRRWRCANIHSECASIMICPEGLMEFFNGPIVGKAVFFVLQCYEGPTFSGERHAWNIVIELLCTDNVCSDNMFRTLWYWSESEMAWKYEIIL